MAELRILAIDPAERMTVSIRGRVTCLCPVNGRRDYGSVEVVYSPVGKLIELESYSEYLGSMSGRAITHEELTAEIANTVYQGTESDNITVRSDWDAIEGVSCSVTAFR